LIDRHSRSAVGYAVHILGDRHEAEDIAQEGFLRALVAARNGTYDPKRGRFAPFFFRILRNLALDRIRARRGTRPLEAVGDPPSRTTASPLASLEGEERRERLHGILRTLPDHERAALVLREYEDLSYQEIAETLGANLEQVRSWIFRARRRIEREWLRVFEGNGVGHGV
jgi:RNA polymerase sigma-70 factor (ECF subfamily)